MADADIERLRYCAPAEAYAVVGIWPAH